VGEWLGERVKPSRPPNSSIYPSSGSTAQIGPWHPPLRFLNHTELDTQGRTPRDE
jgi:hypothetical protein